MFLTPEKRKTNENCLSQCLDAVVDLLAVAVPGCSDRLSAAQHTPGLAPLYFCLVMVGAEEVGSLCA